MASYVKIFVFILACASLVVCITAIALIMADIHFIEFHTDNTFGNIFPYVLLLLASAILIFAIWKNRSNLILPWLIQACIVLIQDTYFFVKDSNRNGSSQKWIIGVSCGLAWLTYCIILIYFFQLHYYIRTLGQPSLEPDTELVTLNRRYSCGMNDFQSTYSMTRQKHIKPSNTCTSTL